MTGNLFADYFLTNGIKATSEWRTSVAAAQFETFRDGVCQRYDALIHSQDPNEAVTDQFLLRPVLELLGWTDYLPQQGASRNEEILDLLLFPDADAKERAIARDGAEERCRDAVAVEESKRFGLPLDACGRDGRRRATTPYDQTIRYLSTAEVESEGRISLRRLTDSSIVPASLSPERLPECFPEPFHDREQVACHPKSDVNHPRWTPGGPLVHCGRTAHPRESTSNLNLDQTRGKSNTHLLKSGPRGTFHPFHL